MAESYIWPGLRAEQSLCGLAGMISCDMYRLAGWESAWMGLESLVTFGRACHTDIA